MTVDLRILEIGMIFNNYNGVEQIKNKFSVVERIELLKWKLIFQIRESESNPNPSRSMTNPNFLPNINKTI